MVLICTLEMSSCISYFCVVVIKIPVRNDVREERFILLIFSEEFQFVTAGKSGWDSSICGFASLNVGLFILWQTGNNI